MKRIKETVKTCLILLLTASAVFLALRGGFFSGLFPGRRGAAEPEQEEPALSYVSAALPAAAAVTGPGGLRCGVKYDGEAMAELYEGFSAILAEVLGSAEKAGVISDFTWRDRLGGENLFLDYGFELPVSVLAAWVGVEAAWADGESGSAFLLDDSGTGSVRLSCRGADGRCFQCSTAASWSTLRALLEEYRPNGAAFAFELAALADCEPYMLVLEELPTVYSVHVSADPSAAGKALAELFGVSLGSQSRYTEADGTLVYPGDGGVLRLWSDGSVGYAAAEGSHVSAEGAAGQIEAARKLLETVHAAFGEAEELRLSAVEQEASGDLSLSFSYVLGGVRVDIAEGPAARAVWKDGRLSELMIRPRSYRLGEPAADLLPEMQAAAAAGSLRSGAAAALILPDLGKERLSPKWVVTVDGRNLWTQAD